DAKQNQENFKYLLQQCAQQQFNATPVYELLDERYGLKTIAVRRHERIKPVYQLAAHFGFVD
ncbi:unnamed protein product, partial [marine sediment metagenome]